VPTFANPTGGCLPADRRAALVDLAHRTGTTIVEDDCYREFAYRGIAPPSLWSHSAGAGVVRVGSFAKTVAPGLRLGFLTGPRAFVATLAQRGVVDSGGGVNHTTAMAMAAYGDSGEYGRHLDRVRAGYRAQRDALTGALRERLALATFREPAGGWFAWLRLPDRVPASTLVDHAARHGVAFLPGPRCYVRPADRPAAGERYVRLSFSLYEPSLLVEAVHRLARALDDATGAPRPPEPGQPGRSSPPG